MAEGRISASEGTEQDGYGPPGAHQRLLVYAAIGSVKNSMYSTEMIEILSKFETGSAAGAKTESWAECGREMTS